ncbi:hypothetical protein [Bacillus sp. FSL K6-3431]|uniref:hypothetical protein n=1 Tax=Bacillus sp. FSL K6-3431 TaxID=2921500 RepID=UPI0030FC613F
MKTYPKMNEAIKDLLGKSDDIHNQYVVARIVDLEKEVERLQMIDRSYSVLKKAS